MPNFNYVQVQPNSTGVKMDTAELVNGTNTVERQILTLGDPTTAANIIGVVAKGSQGAFAAATQDLKDSGRVSVVFVNPTTGGQALTTTEALMSFNVAKLGSALAASGTSYNVTTGKTLRVQTLNLSIVSSAAQGIWFYLRGNTSGTVTTTSNVLFATSYVSLSTWTNYSYVVPDGFEIAGGTSIGIGALSASGTTAYVNLVGYEY